MSLPKYDSQGGQKYSTLWKWLKCERTGMDLNCMLLGSSLWCTTHEVEHTISQLAHRLSINTNQTKSRVVSLDNLYNHLNIKANSREKKCIVLHDIAFYIIAAVARASLINKWSQAKFIFSDRTSWSVETQWGMMKFSEWSGLHYSTGKNVIIVMRIWWCANIHWMTTLFYVEMTFCLATWKN